MSGTKNDASKVRMGLLPPDVLRLTAQVFTKGAQKYSAWNWCKGFEWSRLYDALQRHLIAFSEGEDVDPEWGVLHLGHAMCCLMMLTAHQLRGLGTDDRHKLARGPNPCKEIELGPLHDHDSFRDWLAKQQASGFAWQRTERAAESLDETSHDDGYRLCLKSRFPHMWKKDDASTAQELENVKRTTVLVIACPAHESH